ncbi:porin, partial [Myxococcus xanthus]|nr:porin [Myxococcus xanthus]
GVRRRVARRRRGMQGGVAIMTAARSDHNIPGSPMQKAGFQLESGFGSSIGEAAKTFFGRQSEVHLSGSFGKIRLGNWIPESYYTVADYGVQDQPNHDTGNFSNRLYQSVAVAGYAKLGDNWDAGLHGHY